jgi:hypothetical protein
VSSGDAGSSDAQGNDAPADTGAMQCIQPPSDAGTEADFCNLLAAKASICGQCSTCTQQDADDCVAFGNALSDVFKNTLQQCKDALGCNDLTKAPSNPCVQGMLASATRDAAQQRVKDTFCAACPNTPECAGFFDFSADASSTSGLGAWAVLVDDVLDQQLTNMCSNAAHCSAALYDLCALNIFCGAVPPSHCVGGVCH